MNSMFENNKSFNQNIKGWDVKKVKDMNQHTDFAKDGFLECKYNPFCDKYRPKDKEELTKLCKDIKISLADIDVSSLRNFAYVFLWSTRTDFTGIEDWDVSNANVMSCLFKGAKYFNNDLSKWNVSNVGDMDEMFRDAISFNQNLSMWDVSKVKDHSDFATNCPINNTDKMPKFKP